MATNPATTSPKSNNTSSSVNPSNVLPPATVKFPDAQTTTTKFPDAQTITTTKFPDAKTINYSKTTENTPNSNVDVSLTQPNAPLDTQTASQKSEEKENGLMAGLGKFGRNGMAPWLFMGGLALAAAMGAPMWLVVAGGLFGWALIAASRNGDDKPNPYGNGDIPLGNQRHPQERGRGLDIAIDPLNQPNIDIPLGAAQNNNGVDIPLNGSINNNGSLNNNPPNNIDIPIQSGACQTQNNTCQVPANMLMTVPTNIPPLNGVQYSGDNNGVVSSPTFPNAQQQKNGLSFSY